MNITLDRDHLGQLIRGETVEITGLANISIPDSDIVGVTVHVNIILADIGFGNILNDIEDAINEDTE